MEIIGFGTRAERLGEWVIGEDVVRQFDISRLSHDDTFGSHSNNMLLNFMIVLDCLANWLEGIEQRLLIELEDWSSQQSVQVVGVKLEEDTNLSLIFYDFFHVKDAGMPDAFERFQ